MTGLIVKLFIKDPSDTKSPRGREAYGILAGAVGICMNVILCGVKFMIGVFSGSIAIQADAVNNLSDAGSSVITLIGFKAAGRPADKEHPFGHARLEYISALIVAFLILVVGFELGKESVRKIIDPTTVEFSPVTIAVLVVSILAKLWMSFFTSEIGRRIDSKTMKAATADSISDMISTAAILLSAVIGYFTGRSIDGWMGAAVAAFVLYSGVKVLKDTVSPLMGEAPSSKLVNEISEKLLSYDGINGIHDLVIHSYGPGRIIATVHAEVASTADLLEIHETVDRAEREIGENLGLLLTVHLDPFKTDDETTAAARSLVQSILREIDPGFTFHDFRMKPDEHHTDMIFDLVVPYGSKRDYVVSVKNRIKDKIRECDPDIRCVITVDMGGGE
ncbi:MAG: Ferrous-iron efflux pump FieF [Firmicutes bacterium ADurb.Bin182]|nr:MAG: Ferrous-iron efflux pump FieF [Firmicutes bacterium ADurb.Bin182]